MNSVIAESFLNCIRYTGRVPLSIISRMNGVSRRTYAIHLKVGKKPVRDVIGDGSIAGIHEQIVDTQIDHWRPLVVLRNFIYF